MDIKKYQMIYKFIITIVICVIFENAPALENSLDNDKVGNIYIVGGTLGHDLNNNNDKYRFIFTLEKKYNLINLSIPEISIYDQLNLLDSISNFDPTNDKIIFLLENFYLESIFFEINYIKSLCKNNEGKCKNFNLITYKELYLPLIEILHRRIEDYFSFTNFTNKDSIIFLVDNTSLNYDKYNIKNLTNPLKKHYFNSKKNYCVIYDYDMDNVIKLSYDCLIYDL